MESGHKISLGKEGEEMAAEFLEKQGYEILERNYRFGHGEIDIICKDGKCLVFVEVKTRNTLEFGTPEQAVSKGKLSQIKKIAEGYFYEKEVEPEECRIDVVAILKLLDSVQFNHIKNAYIFFN